MEDALATKDQICECPSCRAQITKGQPCFSVATMQPGRPGRNVCTPCYARYEMRSITSKKPTGESLTIFSMSFTDTDIFMLVSQPSWQLPDPQVIHQSVNASQWKYKLFSL
jgi:hypothetical protein